jgi:hypothetical protein
MVALLGYRVVTDLYNYLNMAYNYWNGREMDIISVASKIGSDVLRVCKQSFISYLEITVVEFKFIPLSVAVGTVFMIISYSIYHIYGHSANQSVK